MSARTGVKALARRNLLQSFLRRESPASLPGFASTSSQQVDEVAAPGPFAAASNPFAPSKDANANSWTAPRYSLRRQKMLRRELEMYGLPQDVLPPAYAKYDVKAIKRQQLSQTSPQLFRSSPHIPGTKVLDELNLTKKGPYVGRKGMAFKGKMWERKFAQRQEHLKAALATADAKVEQWKKSKAEDKAKSKPVVPF